MEYLWGPMLAYLLVGAGVILAVEAAWRAWERRCGRR